MGLFTPLEYSEAVRLCGEHGLDIVAVEGLEAGSVNSNFVLRSRDGSRWFARIYEEQGVAGARAEHTLLRELSRAGVPTVVPVGRIGSHDVPTVSGKPFAVYPWVDGEILCQAKVTPKHCERVGEALAKLHLATSAVSELPPGRFGVADIESRLERIERDPVHAQVARELRTRLRGYAARRDAGIPRGIIHGDLFKDNVLWRAGEIACVIDFESASSGTFAFDLMVTLEAWCYSSEFVPGLVASLLEGYHRTRPLVARELQALPVEGAVAAIRFATTRITDFSMRAPAGAAPKRDYRRFLDRLAAMEAGALSPAIGSLRPPPADTRSHEERR